jgi:hypothetical protein
MPRDVTFHDAGIRSPILRTLNASGAAAARIGWIRPRLDAKDLMDAARRQTGLEDFGDGRFLSGLEALLESLAGDANLTTFGRLVQKKMLTRFLTVRLAVTDWNACHPEALNETIRAPWVIAGLPRTGTTLLSHLLELDPRNRSLLGWEALDPAPPGPADSPAIRARIAHAEKDDAQLNQLIPPLQAMHPMEPTLPTECVTLFACDFRSLLFSTQTPIPSYARWLQDAEMDSAYEFHRGVLQLLQCDHEPLRWSLKTPQHLWSFAALFRTYPDARVIWTHRDPRKVVPSVASLNMAFYRTFTKDPDPKMVGQEWNRELSIGVRKGMEFDKQADPGWCAHLLYEELMEDPIAALRKVYAVFGEELLEDHAEAIRQWLSQRPQSNFGRHRYDAKDFGMDVDEIDNTFSTYIERFGIPRERRD